MITRRNGWLRKTSIIVGLSVITAGGVYKGVVWASTRQSVDECKAEADTTAVAAKAGAIEAVRIHQSLEAEIHKTMIQRMDYHEDTIERHGEQLDKTNTEILFILRGWRKNGKPK